MMMSCMQDAILSCPVDCIHWVRRDELPSLEYMTQKMSQRVDVGTMMGGAGGSVNDVFSAADRFIKSRGKRCGPCLLQNCAGCACAI